MKYVIVIPDGCADEPQESLNGKTPLQAANVPNMDAIAKAGAVGRTNNVPDHLPAGSDVANLSLLGYSPLEYFTGRAPMEAAAQGIELAPEDWAIRCNLVTIQDQIMKSFTAEQIPSEQAKALLQSAQESIAEQGVEFHPGVSYRNLVVYRGAGRTAPFSMETRTTPPHDLTDKSVADGYPRGPGSDWLSEMMSKSVQLFADHPINQQRIAEGLPPATNVWLWGLGKRPALASFFDLHQKKGTMITAVDLLRGLAALIGWDRIEVPGATGYLDTDYAAKGQYGIKALENTDVVCVHVEATDEASHEGDIPEKIKALEEIDSKIVGPLHEAIRQYGDYRMIVLPDHPTFCRTKTHSHGYVPLTVCGTGIDVDAYDSYDEVNAHASDLCFEQGWNMMPYFLGK